MYPCDLHSHTLRSDGADNYIELIDAAVRKGVKILAVTDHDIAPLDRIDVGGREMPPVEYAKGKGLTLLPGIEFSCDTRVDDVHIIGLGCDFSHRFFELEHINSVRSKVDGYKALCVLLTADGMPIDWGRDILLDGRRAESGVQRKMIFEAMAQKGYVASWSDAKLLVKREAKYEVKREKPDPVHIIDGIHQAGGIAILAHPYLIADQPELNGRPATREAYIGRLIAAGLDGIEASYPYSKTSYDRALTDEQVEAEVRARYAGRLRVISGGSDYHNEGKKGSANPRELGEKGVTMEYFMGNPTLRGLIK